MLLGKQMNMAGAERRTSLEVSGDAVVGLKAVRHYLPDVVANCPWVSTFRDTLADILTSAGHLEEDGPWLRLA